MIPPSFKEFIKDPIKALLFLALMSIGYLYFDVKSTMQSQIDSQQIEITSLRNEIKLLQNVLLSTITNHTKPNEIRYINPNDTTATN